MNMTRIIAFTGLAGSGKDTAASFLLPMGYRQMAIANSVKEVAALIAKENVRRYHDRTEKERFSSVFMTSRREALQTIGDVMRDMFHDGIWIDSFVNEAIRHDKVVVTDLRYQNEAEALIKYGAMVVRLVRPGAGLSGSAASHISEQPLPDHLVHAEVVNDSTIDSLREKVLAVEADFKGGAK